MWIVLTAAIAPALVLLYYVYSNDFNPEPRDLVLRGFAYGGLATFASTLISGPLLNLGLYVNEPTTFLEAVSVSFFGAALPEEAAKLFMLWLLLRNRPEFNERYDGLVYAASVGLGFACLENLMYVLSSGSAWFYVSVSRAFLAVPGHFAFAIVMGYYYSRIHFDGTDRMDKIRVWLYPMLLHGIYDTLAFSSELPIAFSGLISLALLYFCYRLFKFTRNRILTEAAANRRDNTLFYDPENDDGSPDEQ
ncbi:MAG: PrsW family intramembrane metalloprotease [Bacteroidales bacterium]|nr:PrsW family intramembrane metalloprotease [Bacteroidales bacterium]